MCNFYLKKSHFSKTHLLICMNVFANSAFTQTTFLTTNTPTPFHFCKKNSWTKFCGVLVAELLSRQSSFNIFTICLMIIESIYFCFSFTTTKQILLDEHHLAEHKKGKWPCTFCTQTFHRKEFNIFTFHKF